MGSSSPESTCNRTATQRIRCARSQHQRSAHIAGPAPATTEDGTGATVLVVEDQPRLGNLVAKILELAGHHVFVAPDGPTALTLTHGQHLDLVITNVAMPQMKGPELVAALRISRPELPVVYMSGYTGESLPTDERAWFLQKPFTMDELDDATAQARAWASAPTSALPNARYAAVVAARGFRQWIEQPSRWGVLCGVVALDRASRSKTTPLWCCWRRGLCRWEASACSCTASPTNALHDHHWGDALNSRWSETLGPVGSHRRKPHPRRAGRSGGARPLPERSQHMFKRFGIALSAIACGGAMLAAPASAQTSDDEMVKSYRAELAPLNAPGSGQASIEVVNRQASVSIQASDLSPAVAPHAQHIHGELGAANTCPDPDTADADGDGLVTTAEGVPSYGGIQVSLTTEGDTSADSALAVDRFPTTEQGAYSYNRTVPLSSDVADAFGNLHIVVHGIDLNKSGEYDGERRSSISEDLPLEATIPTACGAIKLTDIDLPARYDGASGIEGTVIRLYVSMLDRIPDPSGFEYWVNQLEADASVRTIAWSFAESDEFQERYGDMLEAPTRDWVDFVYSAVLGRIADQSGRQYWIDQIDAGNVSRTEMLILFSESDEFKRLTGTHGYTGLQQTCQSPDGFTISYPADWDAVSDCGQFGPVPVEEPEQGTDERTGAVSAYVDPVAFEEASESVDGEQSRTAETVDGLQAVRVVSQSTGEGLYPAGTDIVTWMVDLSAGANEPDTLFVDAVDIFDDVDFDHAVRIMDRMVSSLEITAAARS